MTLSMQPKHFESLYPGNTRDKEIGEIVSFIKEGGSVQLIGLPGVGRSNILGLLSYNHKVHLRHFPTHHKDVHFVMLNFSEVRGSSLSDVWKFILLSIVNSLDERGMTTQHKRVEGIFKKSLSYHDEFVMGQGLKSAIEYLAVEEKLTIIFLFDRFDSFVPSITKDFFTMLGALRDRAKYRFSVIFSLARPLDDLVDSDTLHDFSDFISGNLVYVAIQDEVSVLFRLSYLEKMINKTMSSENSKHVLKLTGGHIRLAKLAYEAALANGTTIIDTQFLRQQKKIDGALRDIWNELTPSEQESIKVGKSENEGSYLERIGLFKSGQLQIPILKDWLDQLPPEKEDLVLDSESKTIKLGERVLSDDLTKSEYRLLSYLLTHKDQIIERDEIVQQVWTQGKSIEGVTEQAVDQLIFRLRRKVEKDPNHPTHLLTVKGRGLKLI